MADIGQPIHAANYKQIFGNYFVNVLLRKKYLVQAIGQSIIHILAVLCVVVTDLFKEEMIGQVVEHHGIG